MINFTDFQEAFLIALAIPIQWLAVFYLIVTILLMAQMLAWMGARRFMNL